MAGEAGRQVAGVHLGVDMPAAAPVHLSGSLGEVRRVLWSRAVRQVEDDLPSSGAAGGRMPRSAIAARLGLEAGEVRAAVERLREAEAELG